MKTWAGIVVKWANPRRYIIQTETIKPRNEYWATKYIVARLMARRRLMTGISTLNSM